MYKPKENDLQYARLALIERLASPAQVQKAMGLLRKITEAGGTAPPIGEVLMGQNTISAVQHEGLMRRLSEVEGAIADAKGGLHEVPRRLGAYEIIERIGRGGMGAVYKARQLHMDRIVALKILAAHLTRDRKYIRQFIREARAAGQISHPNLVAVHEVGQAGPHFFICMEYVEGRPLSRELLAKSRLAPDEVLRIAAQVASALAAAEKRGIVHRDIKPDNLLLTPRGDVKVADLGLAKRLSDVTSASQSGWGCGTPYYMAPEQARNSSAVDIRADIYALGATLYHLVTGRLAFDAASSVEVLMRAASERLIPPSVVRPDVPAGLSDLIERMMSKAPEGRPQNTAQLLAQIEAVRRNPGRPAECSSSVRRTVRARGAAPGRPAWVIPALQVGAWLLAAAAAALAVYLMAAERKPAFRAAPSLPPGYGAAHLGDADATVRLPDVPAVDTAGEAAAREAIAAAHRFAAVDDQGEMARTLLLCNERMAGAGRLTEALTGARGRLEARLELLAGHDIERRRWLAEQNLRRGRLAEAAAALDGFETAWPGTAAAEALDGERAKLDARIVAAAGEIRTRFAELVEAGRFERAGELLDRASGDGLASWQAWRVSAGELLSTARARAARLSQELRDDSGRVAGLLREADERMLRWDFRGAARSIEEGAAGLSGSTRAAERAALALGRARALLAFVDDLVVRIKAVQPPIEDTAFRDRPEGLVVRGAYPGGLLLGLRDGTGNDSILTWAVLSADERMRLARQVGDRRASGEHHLGMGLLCLTSGQTIEAERYLRSAAQDEAVRERAVRHLRELELLATADEEAAAERLEATVRELLEGAESRRAVGGIGTLLSRFGRTARVGTRRAAVEALLREATRECVTTGPLAGHVSELLPGFLRVEYDFGRAGAADDWAPPPDMQWLRDAAPGDLLVELQLQGEIGGLVLVLEPRVAAGRRAPQPLRLAAAGPAVGEEILPALPGADRDDADEAAGDNDNDAAGAPGRMELSVRGDRLVWVTPVSSGRAPLPREILDGLTRREIEGWRLHVMLPPDGPRLTAAAVECGFSENARRSMSGARREAGRAALARAMALPEPWLQARDLDRVSEAFRDVPEVAAQAELARCRALYEERKGSEVRTAVGRLLALYGEIPEVAAAARGILEGMGSGQK